MVARRYSRVAAASGRRRQRASTAAVEKARIRCESIPKLFRAPQGGLCSLLQYGQAPSTSATNIAYRKRFRCNGQKRKAPFTVLFDFVIHWSRILTQIISINRRIRAAAIEANGHSIRCGAVTLINQSLNDTCYLTRPTAGTAMQFTLHPEEALAVPPLTVSNASSLYVKPPENRSSVR